MIQFDISTLAETLTEGGTYSFTVTPKAALSGAMDIRWVIVPKGKIPITANDFSDLDDLEGTVSFASGATAADKPSLSRRLMMLWRKSLVNLKFKSIKW